jgi:ketosteroid isomerase-like protein
MSDRALQRLADRAEISDLLLAFARALDTRDWDAYAQTFAEDGEFRIFDQVRVGREEIAAGPARDLTRFDRTQHFSTNHVIDVDGDRATAQSYMLAIHVPDAAKPDEHADIGGTYRCECVRTPEGWRFQSVAIEVWWTAGAQFAIEHEPAAG